MGGELDLRALAEETARWVTGGVEPRAYPGGEAAPSGTSADESAPPPADAEHLRLLDRKV